MQGKFIWWNFFIAALSHNLSCNESQYAAYRDQINNPDFGGIISISIDPTNDT